MDYLLRLHEVLHNYNGRTVLDIPELNISRGSITGLAGPNGSGKSTLLKILSLAEKCSSGTVYFENKPVLPYAREARHRITLLPQETYLLRRSVFDNISFGLKIRGHTTNLIPTVTDALKLVGLSSSFASRQWSELSGGESQRVALAARLALKPACLLLDEPTASVDMASARSIRRAVLLARKEWGTTLVIASHNQAWLNDICDDITNLYNGRVLDCGYENVLLGPWEKDGEKEFYIRLADGQRIHVSQPPHPESSAVIAPEVLKFSKAQNDTNDKTLTGIITGIFLDKHFPGPRIQVVCGDQRLVASGTDDIFFKGDLRPGQDVTLHYRPEDITWLKK
ncbi:MAG: energy-coupling factor ABC transporter ATP-binding protein [Desulfobulbales bacterium]